MSPRTGKRASCGKSADHDQRAEAFARSDVALPAWGMMETMRASATEKMSSSVGTREGALHAFAAPRRECASAALCEDAASTAVAANKGAQSRKSDAASAAFI